MLLHIVRQIFPDTIACFYDTGLEFPEIRSFVKSIDNVVFLKPKLNFKNVIQKYGYPIITKRVAQYVNSAKRNPECVCAKYLSGEIPSKMFGMGNGKYWYLVDAPFNISAYCCNVMKKQPSKRFQKESGLHPIVATMAYESVTRRNDWLQNGCNVFDRNEPISKPMSFWTEQDILKYLYEYKIPYASVYGDIVQDDNGMYSTTGYKRTGCVFCGFGCHLESYPNRFQRLKQTHPKLFEYCMKPINDGGLGMKEVMDYIHVKVD